MRSDGQHQHLVRAAVLRLRARPVRLQRYRRSVSQRRLPARQRPLPTGHPRGTSQIILCTAGSAKSKNGYRQLGQNVASTGRRQRLWPPPVPWPAVGHRRGGQPLRRHIGLLGSRRPGQHRRLCGYGAHRPELRQPLRRRQPGRHVREPMHRMQHRQRQLARGASVLRSRKDAREHGLPGRRGQQPPGDGVGDHALDHVRPGRRRRDPLHGRLRRQRLHRAGKAAARASIGLTLALAAAWGAPTGAPARQASPAGAHAEPLRASPDPVQASPSPGPSSLPAAPAAVHAPLSVVRQAIPLSPGTIGTRLSRWTRSAAASATR